MRQVEALRPGAPVVVVDEHDGRAVRVAERDVPDVPLDGRADPHRARLDELRHVAEHVVVGLARRLARRRVDRHDAGARVAAAVVRPVLRVQREVPRDHVACAQLRVAPIVRKRECQCSVSGNVVAGSPDSMPEHSVK